MSGAATQPEENDSVRQGRQKTKQIRELQSWSKCRLSCPGTLRLPEGRVCASAWHETSVSGQSVATSKVDNPFRARQRIRIGSAAAIRREMARCYKAAAAGEITSQDAIRLVAALRHIIDLDAKLDSSAPGLAPAPAPAHEDQREDEDQADEGWDDESPYEKAAILGIERETRRERAARRARA
jgi:hypothetical protein